MVNPDFHTDDGVMVIDYDSKHRRSSNNLFVRKWTETRMKSYFFVYSLGKPANDRDFFFRVFYIFSFI